MCTGAREQEVQFVCWTDVDLELKTYTVTEHLDLGYRPKDKEEGYRSDMNPCLATFSSLNVQRRSVEANFCGVYVWGYHWKMVGVCRETEGNKVKNAKAGRLADGRGLYMLLGEVDTEHGL